MHDTLIISSDRNIDIAMRFLNPNPVRWSCRFYPHMFLVIRYQNYLSTTVITLIFLFNVVILPTFCYTFSQLWESCGPWSQPETVVNECRRPRPLCVWSFDSSIKPLGNVSRIRVNKSGLMLRGFDQRFIHQLHWSPSRSCLNRKKEVRIYNIHLSRSVAVSLDTQIKNFEMNAAVHSQTRGNNFR